MFFFGRRKKQEPRQSETYLARQADIEALIAAEPAPREAMDEEMWGHVYQPAIHAFDNADFGKLDELYAAQPDSEHRVVWWHALRNAVSEASVSRRQALFEGALQHESAVSLMLASNLAVAFGFDVRGEGTADTVSVEEHISFEEWNARGHDLMERAAELGGHTDPFAYIVGHGASVTDDDCGLTHAKKWQAIDPWNPMGWADLLRQQDARWSGDWTALPRMAKYVAEQAPAGHPVLAEVVSMLNQHWFTLRSFGELSSDDAQAAAWRNAESTYAVGHAYAKFASAYDDGIRAVRHWDRFAFGLAEVGLYEELLGVMRRQRGVYCALWQDRYRDPADIYGWCRAEAIQVTFRRANPLPEDAHDDVDWGPKGPPTVA